MSPTTIFINVIGCVCHTVCRSKCSNSLFRSSRPPPFGIVFVRSWNLDTVFPCLGPCSPTFFINVIGHVCHESCCSKCSKGCFSRWPSNSGTVWEPVVNMKVHVNDPMWFATVPQFSSHSITFPAVPKCQMGVSKKLVFVSFDSTLCDTHNQSR